MRLSKFTKGVLFWGALALPAVGCADVTPQAAIPSMSISSVEYYHAELNHYFMTAYVEEIAALDAGTIKGWVRTGQSFKVMAAPLDPSAKAVCRYFSDAFAPKSSHFYSPFASECNSLLSSTVWRLESQAFYVVLSRTDGTCTGGDKVYRLYNNGQGGAPNHRYTTSPLIRADMIAQGWIPEGMGQEGVEFCTSTL